MGVKQACFYSGLKRDLFFSCELCFIFTRNNYLRLKRESTVNCGHIQTKPEEFENGGFTLKTHQMLSVHTTTEEFENATITGNFGFVFEENSAREITLFSA